MSPPDRFSKEAHAFLNPILGGVLLLRPEMMKDESSFLEMDITEEQRKKLIEKLAEKGDTYKLEGAEANAMTKVEHVFEWYDRVSGGDQAS